MMYLVYIPVLLWVSIVDDNNNAEQSSFETCCSHDADCCCEELMILSRRDRKRLIYLCIFGATLHFGFHLKY